MTSAYHPPLRHLQKIATIFHALSKWRTSPAYKHFQSTHSDLHKNPYQEAIIKLVNEILQVEIGVNPQEIATILHALAKWSMPSDYKQPQSTFIEVHTSPYKEAILKIVNAISKLNISFNPKEIHSEEIQEIVYALDRWQYVLKKHDSDFDNKLFWKVSARLGSHFAKPHRS